MDETPTPPADPNWKVDAAEKAAASKFPAWARTLAIIAAAGSPVATGLGTYYSAGSAIEKDLASARLEAEQRFAQKSDLDDLSKQVGGISNQVSEIRGLLRGRRLYDARSPDNPDVLKPVERAVVAPARGDDG